jgi:predicted transcriptional regulator
MPDGAYLSKRMQQVIDLLYQHESLTAVELENLLPGRPNNSTVRSHLRVLEERGLVSHKEDGSRFVFFATNPRPQAAKTAIQKLVDTFFAGSAEAAVAALLSSRDQNLSQIELERIAEMIEVAKREALP